MVGPGPRRIFPGPPAFWAILACVLWGSAFPTVRIALGHLPLPFIVGGARFILAGLLLLPLCGRWAAMGVAIRKHWRLILAVSMLQTILLYGTFFWGMMFVHGAQGAIVIGSSPLMAALMAHFLMHDDRMTVRKACAIGLGLAGVGIIAAWTKPWAPGGLRQLGGLGLLPGGARRHC